MVGIVICLAIIALAEVAGVYFQFRNTHLADEIGRLENMLLSEREKFGKYQENVLTEMVSLRKENDGLKQLVASYQSAQEYIGIDRADVGNEQQSE